MSSDDTTHKKRFDEAYTGDEKTQCHEPAFCGDREVINR